MHTHTNPWGRLKWLYAIIRLTAHFMCGLMSYLVIGKFRKSMGICDTECPYWDQVSLNNTNQTINPVMQWPGKRLCCVTQIYLIHDGTYKRIGQSFHSFFSPIKCPRNSWMQFCNMLLTWKNALKLHGGFIPDNLDRQLYSSHSLDRLQWLETRLKDVNIYWAWLKARPSVVNMYIVGACGPVVRALGSRSKGLGFRSHSPSCVEVLRKLIPYCLCLRGTSSHGYLVDKNYGGVVKATCVHVCVIFSQDRWDCSSGLCPIPGKGRERFAEYGIAVGLLNMVYLYLYHYYTHWWSVDKSLTQW